jgi:hypothetical protein
MHPVGRAVKRSFGPALLVLAASCVSPLPHRDAAVDAVSPRDAGHAPPVLVTASRPDPSDRVLPVSPRPADLSCLGTRTLLPRGDLVPTPMTLRDIRTGSTITGLCAHVYLGDVVPSDACATDDPRSGPDGMLTLSAPMVGPFHLRLFPQHGVAALESFQDTTYYDVRPATLGVVTGISTALLNEAALAGGGIRDPARANVGVFLLDCSGHPVYGAELRLLRADGSPIEPGAGAGAVLYGNGASEVSATQPWTHIDGLAAATNVEVRTPGERIFVELVGRAHADDDLTIVACETVQLMAGAVSIPAAMGPRRADGPHCPELP